MAAAAAAAAAARAAAVSTPCERLRAQRSCANESKNDLFHNLSLSFEVRSFGRLVQPEHRAELKRAPRSKLETLSPLNVRDVRQCCCLKKNK
jgi:hypothetical protein